MSTITTPTAAVSPVLHPLAPLTGEEISAARDIVFASGRAEVPVEALRFAYVGLVDPPKDVVRAIDRGEPITIDRRVRLVVLQGPEADVAEVVVSVTRGEVDRWEIVRGVRPPLQIEESIMVLAALHEHPEWNAALDRRGIVDRSLVQIDPWPAGTFGLAHEEGRRITRCLAYLRESKEDNGYARPLEGLLAFVDMGRGEVLEVLDLGVVPFPPKSGSYYPEDNGPLRTDLKPLEITQPEGPSFEVEGNRVRWQKWSLRVGMDPLEGLVLYTVGYEDAGRVRPILYRASVSEMVVPYGDPGPMHAWKSAFDAGEWGLGRMANSLALGCDCLGEIRYFDDVWADERGKPHTRANAICMHEEDYGILWKHVDMVSGRTEVRRSRRLVVSSIATVGNYEYGFYWYFYLDGTMQLEVKLTGIMSTMAVAGGDPARTRAWWPPGWPRPTTSTSSTCGSTWRSTDPTTRSTRWTRSRRGPRAAPRTRGATPSAPRSRCWSPSRRPARRGSVPQPDLAHRQPLRAQRRRGADGLQAAPRVDADAAGRSRLFGRATGRLRRPQPLGDTVRRRGAPRRGGLSEPAPRRGGTPRVDGAGPPDRRHRRRPVALVRRHPRAPARGLAGHAGRIRRLHADPDRFLRPQPRAGRAAPGRPLP